MTSTAAELIAEARRPEGHTASGWGKLAKDLADALEVADRALTVDWAENITPEDESAIRRHMHELAVRNTALSAPRVVSTVAELDALPRHSVIISDNGVGPYRKTDAGWVSPFSGPYSGELMMEPALVSHPLIVLWVGGTE